MSISLNRVFAIYVFLLSFFFASRPISDPDFWFHLKIGQFIVQNLQVPRVEIFSCTNLGQPYIAHGWLSGVVFYLIYSRFGQNLLIFIFAVLTALAFWIIFRRSSEHIFTRGMAVLLGVWTVLPNIGVRPRVFTLVLATCYFQILTRYSRDADSKRLWWLVPLMVLWVNLHGAFLIGLTLIGLAITGVAVDAWIGRQAVGTWVRVKPLLVVLVACTLAALINPYGTKIYSHIFGVLSSPIYQYVGADWLSPDFHQSEQRPLIALTLLTTAVLVLSPKRVKPSELLFFLATLYMTLRMQRNALIFAVVATSLLADYSGALWDSLFAKDPSKSTSLSTGPRPSILNLLLLLPLIIFVVQVKRVVYVPPTQQMAVVPFSAVQYLKDNGLKGCTFTEPNIWSDYLIWATPENPVYIDGRDVYPTQFVKEYVELMQGQRDWRASFDRYGVKNAILTPSSVLAQQLRNSADWKQVYQDDYSLVFTRQ